MAAGCFAKGSFWKGSPRGEESSKEGRERRRKTKRGAERERGGEESIREGRERRRKTKKEEQGERRKTQSSQKPVGGGKGQTS